MSKFKVGDREDETAKPAKPEPNTFSLDEFKRVGYAVTRLGTTINGVEVPAPEKAALAEDTEYWSARAYTGEPIAMEWIGSTEDHNALKNGAVWLAEADARAALDAMLKPLREYARGG